MALCWIKSEVDFSTSGTTTWSTGAKNEELCKFLKKLSAAITGAINLDPVSLFFDSLAADTLVICLSLFSNVCSLDSKIEGTFRLPKKLSRAAIGLIKGDWTSALFELSVFEMIMGSSDLKFSPWSRVLFEELTIELLLISKRLSVEM